MKKLSKKQHFDNLLELITRGGYDDHLIVQRLNLYLSYHGLYKSHWMQDETLKSLAEQVIESLKS